MVRKMIAIQTWFIVIVLLNVALTTMSCSDPPKTKTPDPAALSYAAELQRCVHEADTLEQSRACRQRVDKKYAPLMDGGGK